MCVYPKLCKFHADYVYARDAQAPAEDDPTAAIVTGPSSSGLQRASPDSMSPSGSQVELSKVSPSVLNHLCHRYTVFRCF